MPRLQMLMFAIDRYLVEENVRIESLHVQISMMLARFSYRIQLAA